MAESKKQPKTKKFRPSIKYGRNAVKGASPEQADFGCQEYAPPISNKHKQKSEIPEPKSVEILSTAELISAVGQIWDRVDPLSILKNNRIPKSNSKGLPREEDISCNLGLEVNGKAPTTIGGKGFEVDLKAGDHVSHMVQASVQSHKMSQMMSAIELCRESYIHSSLQRFTYLHEDYRKGRGVASMRISYELDNIYGWMSYVIPTKTKKMAKTTKVENKRKGEDSIPGDTISSVEGCLSRDQTHYVRNSSAMNAEFLFPGDTITSLEGCLSGDKTDSAKTLVAGNPDRHPDLIKAKDSSSCDSSTLPMNMNSTSSLCSDYFLSVTQNYKTLDRVLSTPKSGKHADYHVNLLASGTSAYKECQQDKTDVDELIEKESKQYGKFVIKEEPSTEMCSTAREKPQHTLGKQEHAFAGALAGICVSLCLHPVDTVKTVIQSCRAEEKSLCYIGRSIVSERGLTGLYRGFSSNIASSAPISAIYTFTYESVKGVLLPLFPKEYYSLAHCIAGGCASVATSFVFTPSERIKQQMQVGSHYRNCWNALVGIIGKGGLSSLYAGWGAVLCRNVPHSIIKFYTYESLKQLMLASQHSNAQPSVLQTLLCGGLAGSTAAFCTTPFDVVKTRLQTQIPGSMSQYNNVLHALQEIGRQEGLKGLYRGLVPRLIMYMSQGALFFSSYEFFKSMFSLGVQQSSHQRIQGQPTMVGNATSTPTQSLSYDSYPLPSSSSSSSKLHE